MRRQFMVVAAGVAAGLGLGAPAAHGQVQITPDRVVVRAANGATADVQRAPFRLTVRDGAGRTVLEQAPNTTPQPTVGVDVFQEPLGGEETRAQTAFEPFAFEVGGQAAPQFPSGPFIGNLVAGASAGTVMSARDVTAAREANGGVELEVSTTDPTGVRKLLVTIRPQTADALRVEARVTPEENVSAVGDAFVAGATERFRGFGGRHNALDQRGNELLGFIQEQNLGAGSLQPAANVSPSTRDPDYLFPNGPTAAFYPQNLFISPGRYGFLAERPELTRWRMAASRPDRWSLAVDGPVVSYVVAPGDSPQAIKAISDITGRHRVPPEWASGPTLYRGVRVLSPEADTGETHAAKVRADLAQIRRRSSPVTSYAIEGWDIMPRETLKGLVREMKAMGIKPLFYIRAYTARDAGNTEDTKWFQEAATRGYLAKTEAGTPFLFGSTFFVGAAGLIDYTNPEARRWWRGRVREMLDLGAEGFMQDFGEQVLFGMRFFDGSRGPEMHNRYPNLYHQTTREVLDEYEKENPGRGPIFFFTRTGYSGTPGGATYENSNFPGDETTDFSRASGLGSLATDMLNRAVGGLFGFNTDIGGYADFNTPPVTKELFIRWSQWAALSPVHRVHNSSTTGTKMPWSFDDEAYRGWARSAELHVEARPLILELWREGVRTGMPPTRPMWLAYPNEAEAEKQDQQWLLGPDVLVAPVVESGASTRRVWFPPGCWEHGERPGERVTGPKYEDVRAPLASLPFFVRCGTQPFAAAAQRAGSSASLGLPSSRRCLSRRRFDIRLTRGLRGARVTVDGRRAPVRRVRGRLVAKVDLRGKAPKTVRVRISGTTRAGRQALAARTYRTCVPRRGR